MLIGVYQLFMAGLRRCRSAFIPALSAWMFFHNIVSRQDLLSFSFYGAERMERPYTKDQLSYDLLLCNASHGSAP